MTRLFTRGVVLILLTVVASFVVAGYIFHIETVAKWEKTPPDFARFAEAFTQGATEGMTPDELTAMVMKLRVEKDLPVEILPFEDPGLEPDILERLARGEPAVASQSRNVAGKQYQEGMVVFVPVEDGARVLVIGPQLPTLPEWDTWLLMMLSVTLVVSAAGVVISLPTVRRLRKLEKAAAGIASGDLSSRTDIQSRDAIGSLAMTFNAMADRIQYLLENQRHMTVAVAHELRTPISRVRFGIEMAARATSPERARERYEALEADLLELDALVEELLVYSRYESGNAHLDPQPLDIINVAQEQLTRFATLYPDLSMEIHPGARAEHPVTLDQLSVDRVLGNLVSNAARYAKSRVEIRVSTTVDALTIEVHDDGPGIPKKDRAKIFDPFTRLDQSRNRALGGTGLGLAIVERVLRSSGGTAAVEDSDLGGARLITIWPL